MGEVRGRLRSSAVTLPTIAVLAASALASCSGQTAAQQRACVDAQQNVIDQRQCTQAGGIGRYYYYSGSSSLAGFGSHISGGSFSSGAASAAASAARVGRGGFGGHGAGAE
jgi:hypothetical protein